MTTGRINQVTILPGRHPAERGPPEPPREVAESLVGRGPVRGPSAQPEGQPGHEAAGRPAGYPIAPAEFPKKRSAPGGAPGPSGPPASWGMHFSSGGYQPPVTPSGTVTGFG